MGSLRYVTRPANDLQSSPCVDFKAERSYSLVRHSRGCQVRRMSDGHVPEDDREEGPGTSFLDGELVSKTGYQDTNKANPGGVLLCTN